MRSLYVARYEYEELLVMYRYKIDCKTPIKTQQKCRHKKLPTYFTSPNASSTINSSTKTRSPNCTASSTVFPLFLPPSIALVLFLLLPPAHSRALSLSPHFLSPSLSLSIILSPQPSASLYE